MKRFSWTLGFSVFLVPALIVLSGCNELEGHLWVKSGFSLNTHKGEAVELNPGSIEAKVGVDNKKSRFEFHFKSTEGKWLKAFFVTPPDFKFPEYSGTFELSSAESGQEVDLVGAVDTTETDSDQQSGWEECTYEEIVRKCRTENGKRRCWDERVRRRGRRYVEFYDHFTTYSLDLDIQSAESDNKLAFFDAENTKRKRIRTHTGRCQRY